MWGVDTHGELGMLAFMRTLSVFLVLLSIAGCSTERPDFGGSGGTGEGGGDGDGDGSGGTGEGGGDGDGDGSGGTAGEGGDVSDGGMSGTGGSPEASGGGPACNEQQKLCEGVCVERSDPDYGCDPTLCDTSTCPTQGTGAILACEGASCIIDSCPADYKKCGDKCVAMSDPTYGCDETSCDDAGCPAPGSGTLVCQAGACVIGSCGDGTKKCGDKCVTTDANNGCADATRCTACASNETCTGSPSTCQCVPTDMSTACAEKCGSVPDGCGGTYSCGDCTAPQSCGGGGTANVCGCTKTQKSAACSGSNCGTVSDGCGGDYTCGTCSSSAPVCVSGTCQQCEVFADCPAGTFNCTNNECKCRIPSSSNLVTNGGFDSPGVDGWQSVSWNSSDRDECPGSGSLTFSSSATRCFAIPTVSGSKEYTFGFQYRSADTVGCIGIFYLDAGCQTSTGTPDFLNLSANASPSSWSLAHSTTTAQNGTSSVLVECTGSTVSMDQVYLGPPWTVPGTYF